MRLCRSLRDQRAASRLATARVVQEVVGGKRPSVEIINDTVRGTQVEVERVEGQKGESARIQHAGEARLKQAVAAPLPLGGAGL